MKLAIIGHGFVGQAVDHGFSKNSVDKFYVDPKYGTTVSDLVSFKPDVIFIAVPTPMGEDRKIDPTILFAVFEDLRENGFQDTLIALKSTVTPDIVDQLARDFSNFVYNPEFLTERNFKEDFVRPPMHIFGSYNPAASDRLYQLYDLYSICEPAPVHKVDPKTASLVKYTINSFLASKVIFFNHMKEIYARSGAEAGYDTYVKMLQDDPRIGRSHLNVPGPDGMGGYGGKCFTKDTNALVQYSRSVGFPFDLLDHVISINEKIRPDCYSEGAKSIG